VSLSSTEQQDEDLDASCSWTQNIQQFTSKFDGALNLSNFFSSGDSFSKLLIVTLSRAMSPIKSESDC
jgi:hypothetical protein